MLLINCTRIFLYSKLMLYNTQYYLGLYLVHFIIIKFYSSNIVFDYTADLTGTGDRSEYISSY